MAEVRLIDANALMKNIGKIPQLRGITYGRMKKAVEETPTIDAVPVVRCKDCKYFMFGDYCMHDGAMEHSHARENDFCSYGERGVAEVDDDENV